MESSVTNSFNQAPPERLAAAAPPAGPRRGAAGGDARFHRECILGLASLLPSGALASSTGAGVAAEHTPQLGSLLPVWSVAPFAAILLCIAVLPLVAGGWWEHNRNKALLSALLGVPVAAWIASLDPLLLAHTAHEYVAFILLLGALFVISGGIVVRGTLAGTPGLNTGLLAIGALLASFVGTTGASMLLIRPLLRANEVRRQKRHVVVFFIFIVANAGGLLTPLGDPPLFLGFLRGVPFLWTLRLWPEWLFVNGVLLALFYVVDSTIFRREDIRTPGDLDEIAERHAVPVHIAGKRNFLYLAGVVAVLLASGSTKLPLGVQEGGMALMAALSWFTTPRPMRGENAFTWGPIVEVAVVFAGIFATMIPALAILNARGAELGLAEPWQFFWATGLLSSFLDNAPTYLTFASAASGIVGTDAANLRLLVEHDVGAVLLEAVALGAVFMGANTYIGNGPNFMVKAIAEQGGVKMPSFFGYVGYSVAILVPLFVALTLLFF
ncbi:MAG TPA: sodium:proton antiporter [Anaeromyxobacteraceae bacterium]|nr:sodium:proton antiporter [Anaeromyxobacteraceae bacterium]